MRRRGSLAAILAVVLLVLAGSIALAAWPLFNPQVTHRSRWRVFEADRVVAEEIWEQSFNVEGPAKLVVDNHFGGIAITGGTGSQVTITARKRVWAPTQAQAEAELPALEVAATQDGNTIAVHVERSEKVVVFGTGTPNMVDFTITVPEQTSVAASTASGAVSLSSTKGEADLETRFGSIQVQDLIGELEATTSSGAVIAQRVEAETGEVNLSSRFGKIEYNGGSAASLLAKTGSGSITLTDMVVGESVVVEDRFGEVVLRGVMSPSYDVSTRNGGIQIEGATGRLRAHSDFGRVSVSRAENVDIDLDTNNGSIDFAGSLGSGPHIVHTQFGAIRLALPAETALSFDLQTDFGQIKPAFPVMITSTQKSHWIGSINGGGANLTATTRSGDIILETLIQ